MMIFLREREILEGKVRIMFSPYLVLDDSQIPEDAKEGDQDLNLHTETGLERCKSVNY